MVVGTHCGSKHRFLHRTETALRRAGRPLPAVAREAADSAERKRAGALRGWVAGQAVSQLCMRCYGGGQQAPGRGWRRCRVPEHSMPGRNVGIVAGGACEARPFTPTLR